MSGCCAAASGQKAANSVRRVRELLACVFPTAVLVTVPSDGTKVSRLPGSARDALDRTRAIAFHGNLPSLGAAVPFASPHCSARL
jgi:hypothetical protein